MRSPSVFRGARSKVRSSLSGGPGCTASGLEHCWEGSGPWSLCSASSSPNCSPSESDPQPPAGPAASHSGSAAAAELVSGRPFSWASWAALACRWARAAPECRHLGEPQRQLRSLPLTSQKRSP